MSMQIVIFSYIYLAFSAVHNDEPSLQDNMSSPSTKDDVWLLSRGLQTITSDMEESKALNIASKSKQVMLENLRYDCAMFSILNYIVDKNKFLSKKHTVDEREAKEILDRHSLNIQNKIAEAMHCHDAASAAYAQAVKNNSVAYNSAIEANEYSRPIYVAVCEALRTINLELEGDKKRFILYFKTNKYMFNDSCESNGLKVPDRIKETINKIENFISTKDNDFYGPLTLEERGFKCESDGFMSDSAMEFSMIK